MKTRTTNLTSSTLIAAFCLLSAAFCPFARAGASWLVDGEAVQTLDVQTTNADPNALYTDGTRTMQAPLVFDPSVSSLFRAYTPWDGMYDFFILDADLEAVKLCSGSVEFYPNNDLIISGTTLVDNGGGGGSVDIGEMTLKGGSWMVDAVGPYDESIISRDFSDTRYHQKSSITTPLKFDPSLSSSVNGLFKATVPWDSEYDFFTFNSVTESVVLSPTVASLGFEVASLSIHGYGIIQMPDEGSYISFEERYFGGGGWVMPAVMDDPSAILNRSYADTRYIQRTEGITINHTIQAGDVLQIQNGIITAINP